MSNSVAVVSIVTPIQLQNERAKKKYLVVVGAKSHC